jgi:hypothetical protein
MSLEMAHKVILPPKKNYIPQLLKQRDINSYCQTFSKILVDICKSRCTRCINATGVNFATGATGVVDNSSKFAADVNDTSANNGNNIRLLTP